MARLSEDAAVARGGLPQIALGTVICSTIFLLTGALGLALLVAPMAQGALKNRLS